MEPHATLREPRVPGGRRGLVEYDDFSCACVIENVSSRGFCLTCLDDFTVGQVLGLKCELLPGKSIQCKVEVRHYADGTVGVLIVDIDGASARVCRELIDEHYAAQLDRRSI